METQHHHYRTVEKAIAYLRSSRESQPDLSEVADAVHLSKFHFQRIFKEWAGVSPKEFVQYLSLERAKEALRRGRSTLDSALLTGLSGTGRLHDLFVKMEGCTPGTFKARGKSLRLYTSAASSPFGPVAIAETPLGICRISFGPVEELLAELHEEYPLADFQEGPCANGRSVQRYLQDWKLPETRIVLELEGSAFQLQVWRALLKSAPGRLLSYRELADAVDNPSAARAIGRAVGSNPVAYLIPCHRVILASGDWGDYRWMPERKMAINAYEGALVSKISKVAS